MKNVKYLIFIFCCGTISCLCLQKDELSENIIRRIYKINNNEITDNILWNSNKYFYKYEIKFRGQLSGKIKVVIYQKPDQKEPNSYIGCYNFDKEVEYTGGEIGIPTIVQ